MQNILVLGRGQDLDQPKNDEKPKIVPTVTLEVSPEEGERLALAAKEGLITLALRGYTETARCFHKWDQDVNSDAVRKKAGTCF